MKTIDVSQKNNKVIEGFYKEYSLKKEPIVVSFRNLIPELKKNDRYTHSIHTYPAKLLVHIPYFFLNNTVFSKEGDTILDPFGGSGTVLLESILANRNAMGADANPLARLIAEVKVNQYNSDSLKIAVKRIVSKARKLIKHPDIPDVVNCDFWFSESVKSQLAKLLLVINRMRDENQKKFMLVSFSNCIKKVSFADPRVSVPVKINPDRYKRQEEKIKIKNRLKSLETIDVFDKFLSIANENIERCKSCEEIFRQNNTKAKIISDDARNLVVEIGKKRKLSDETIQLIITSPPYASAQKYIRASSLNLGWTGLAKVNELLFLDRKNIGRENFRKSELGIVKTGIIKADELIEKINTINELRATIICNYILEMKLALNEMVRVLKKDGYLVLIVGNNKVCNMEFNTQEYFATYLINLGLNLQFKLIDDIHSYGLMTKRNKTADIISREYILVFKK